MENVYSLLDKDGVPLLEPFRTRHLDILKSDKNYQVIYEHVPLGLAFLLMEEGSTLFQFST